MPYTPVGLQKAGFTPSNIISQGNRVTNGRVNITGKFTYNTRFPQQWSKDPRTHKLWEEMVAMAVGSARRKVQIRTGELRDSIYGEVTTGAGGLIQGNVMAGGPGLERWAYIEYGTGSRGKGSPQPEPGTPVGYRSTSGRAGNRAYPYLRPALLEMRTRISSLKGAA